MGAELPTGPPTFPPRTTRFILTPLMLTTSLGSTVSTEGFFDFFVDFLLFPEVLVLCLVPTMFGKFGVEGERVFFGFGKRLNMKKSLKLLRRVIKKKNSILNKK